MCRLSWYLGALTSWNPHGLSRPVMRLKKMSVLHKSGGGRSPERQNFAGRRPVDLFICSQHEVCVMCAFLSLVYWGGFFEIVLAYAVSSVHFREDLILKTSDCIIRKYVLTIWSEYNYIFLHRIVHWVYNYMFRPCILAIVRLNYKLNKQLYNICVGYAS